MCYLLNMAVSRVNAEKDNLAIPWTNTAVQRFKDNRHSILKLVPLRGRIEVEAYGDSAFAADNNQIGVCLVLRQSGSSKVNLIAWRSCKSDRRAWSTLAAETHAMQMAMDRAIGLKYLLHELGVTAKETTVLIDNLNLKKVLYSGRSPAEARLRKEMGILRDMMGQERIKVRFKAQVRENDSNKYSYSIAYKRCRKGSEGERSMQ